MKALLSQFLNQINNLDNKRVFGLDLLRSFAIASVLLGHAGIILSKQYNLSWAYTFLVFDGVSVFFVLSGFLIGKILLKSFLQNPSFNYQGLFNFWQRRWYRTLPNYYFVLLLVTILNIIFGELTLQNCLPFFFFIQNLAWPNPNYFHEFWSLSVEEWFYLIIPILLLIAFKGEKKFKGSVLIFMLLVIVLASFIRGFLYNTYEIDNIKLWDNQIRKLVVTRIDSLIFGLLGAYLSIYFNSLWLKHKFTLLIIGVLCMILHRITFLFDYFNLDFNPFISFNWYYSNVSFFLISIGTLLMLPFLSSLRTPSSKFAKVITFISLTSYSMYIINLTLIQGTLIPLSMKYIFYNIESNEFKIMIELFLFWIYTVVGSFLIYTFYELPIMSYRDKVTTHE